MDQGRLDDAVSSFRSALEIKPDFAEAHYNLANAWMGQDQIHEATAGYRRAIGFMPNYPQAHNNLGNTLVRQGRLDEAVACFFTALVLKPDYLDAYVNLGSALRDQDRLDEAIFCFSKVLELEPNFLQAHNNLGAALQKCGRLDEAVASFKKAIDLKRDYLEPLINLGTVLREQERLEASIACFTRALELSPSSSTVHEGLGNALLGQGLLEDAVSCYGKALAIDPDYSEAHNDLGNALKDLGLLDQALEHYTRAIELKPDYFEAASNRLFTHNYSLRELPAVMRGLAQQYGVLVSSHTRSPFTRWNASSAPDRPLRVGIVSSDLRNHPVGYFLKALLGAADPARITFLAFPSHRGEDDLTAHIRPYFQAWTPIVGLGDEAAARLIHASGVQVLLDLTGHTAHNRLPVFAWRPAPVQAAWLGYFATTGVAEIDYIIGDPHVAPPEEASHFTETVWQLPEIYYCFSPPETPVVVSDLPALSNGYLTFGCFNNLTKLNDAVLVVWARLLHAVPDSRLMLKAPQFRDAGVRERTRTRFAAQGIAEDRLLIELPSSRADYLRAYHRIDIALDPFPYPGGTTSFEALWMGVPVLTKRGDRFLSHAGETILHNAGLPDWIAADDDDYVAKVVHFAEGIDHLATLRARLRDQVLASPLFDAPRFARYFEDAMHGMWKQSLMKPARQLGSGTQIHDAGVGLHRAIRTHTGQPP